MAHGPGVIPCLGFGGRGRPVKNQKPWSLPRIHNNLICPLCHITCDRKQVVWLDKNYGECPTCHKKVHFDLHRPVGRPPINSKTPEIQFKLEQPQVEDNHAEVQFVELQHVETQPTIQKEFSDYVARMKEISHPCRYLSCKDICKFTGISPIEIARIKRKVRYKNYIGRRSDLTEMLRQAVLTAITEGLTPPDLKYFME